MTTIATAELDALRARAAERAQGAPSAEREFNRALLESMADGVVACDADGVLTIFNRTAREWHGTDPLRVPPAEWPSRYDLYRANGHTPLAPDEVPLARALRGEEVVDAGMAIAARGRPVRYILANGSRITDDAGRNLGAVVVMRDVTELRRVEAALRRANAALEADVDERAAQVQRQHLTLRGIVESVSTPIFSLDRDYRYTSFNRPHAAGMAALYNAEIAVGHSLLDAMTVASDRAIAKANIDRAMAGEAFEAEALSGEDSRSRLYFRVAHSPIRDAAGEVIGVAVMAQDLTERRRAELALEQSERRYRDVFDNVVDGLYLLDVLDDGRFRTMAVNPALERMTGIPRAYSVGKTQEETVPAEVAQIVNAKYRRCVEARHPIEEEAVLDLPAGRRHVLSVLVPACDAEGRVQRIVGITRDITDRRRQEAINAARLNLMQLAVTRSLDGLLEAALNAAEALSGSTLAFFHGVDGGPRSLRLQSGSTRTKASGGLTPGAGNHHPWAETGAWVDCVQQRKPLIYNAVQTPTSHLGGPDRELTVVRELVVPVLRGDRVRAVVGVGNKAVDYVPEDIEAVRLIAELAWEIAERKLAEIELARVNRALRMLSDSNQALIRITDEAALLREVCRVVVEVGGYRLARVGFPGPEDAGAVRWQARAGGDPRCPAAAGADGADGENGEGDGGGAWTEALRTGQRCVARRDAGAPANAAPWWREALGCGCDAVAALPLVAEDRRLGALEVHARDPEAFDQEELAILAELASDLAFGITALRTRAKRDEAREELRRSEKKYRELIARIHAAVIVHGADTRIVVSNPRAQELLGLTEAQLAGVDGVDPRWHFIREDGSRLPSEAYPVNRVIATGQPLRNAVLGVCRPGDPRVVWVLVSADPSFDATDALTQVIVTFTDITDRRRVEQDLADTAQRLNEAQRLAHIGSWELDLVANTLTWSDEIYRMFEVDRSRFGASYEAFLGAIHPDDRAPVNAAYTRSLATRTPYCIDHRLLLAGGRIRYVHEECETFFDQDRPLRSVGTVQDVTERKRADDALRERESFIRTILDSVDDGFTVVDRDFRILAANKAYCETVGLPEAQVLGRPCYEVNHHRTEPCFASGDGCPVWRSFTLGGRHSDAHTRVDERGDTRHVELRSYPITDGSGAVVSAIETLRDVTERTLLEDQLHQAQKMEAVGTLAGGVAHDFNNLLTAIIGYGHLMQFELGPDDPGQVSLSEILAAADRAAQLTQGLLAFSRKQIINPKPIDLEEIVRNVERLLRRVIGEDIELTATLSGGDLRVMADAGQIEQVLMNLATNARDAMPHGGQLAITARPFYLAADRTGPYGEVKRGRYALLAVTDSGAGMDERTRDKAFEPFFTTKEVGRGTGLGLAIVFGIIKQHGGSIDLRSAPGAGTTFRILLPLLEPEAEQARAMVLAEPTRGSETILVAEDDPMVRKLLGSVLRGFGYRVIEAVDGADALAQFAEHGDEVDMLVVDVVMPKKSGREVYDAVRAQRPDVRVLFVSGYTADIIHKRGVLDEGLQFVSKPLSPHDLLRRIRTILDERA